MPSLPSPFRAAIGLAAQALQDAKHLPDKAIELPMLAVSTALQLSLRAQQRYAQLAARGDDVLNHRPTTDEPPPWATFDDPIRRDDGPVIREVPAAGAMTSGVAEPQPTSSAQTASGNRVPANTFPANTVPAKTVPAEPAPRKTAAAKTAPRKTAPRKTVPAKAVPAKVKPRKSSAAKTVRSLRNTAPSPFDTIGDE
ncbi:MAG: hypothetical protein ABI232_02350 [Jatrophihabitantaceae bacterium]